MHVGDEHLAGVVQRAQEGGLLAVAAVDADPGEPHPAGPRRAHDLQRQLRLRAQLARRHRDPAPVAALRIFDPAPRQVEPHVDRRVPLAIGQHREHRDLAIVDLAKAAAPLPGNTHRVLPLFDEAALVDDQGTGRLATEQTIGVTADLLHHRLMPPRRVADEVLELLLAALLDHRRHRREGRFLRLREPLQVALRHRRVVPRPRAEEPTVTADEAAERHRDTLDQRCRQPSAAHTVTRRIDGISSPPFQLRSRGVPLIRSGASASRASLLACFADRIRPSVHAATPGQ